MTTSFESLSESKIQQRKIKTIEIAIEIARENIL